MNTIAMMKQADAHIRSLESKHLKYEQGGDTKDTKLNDLEKRLSKIVTKRGSQECHEMVRVSLAHINK